MTENSDGKRADFTGVIFALVLSPLIFLSVYLDKEDIGRSIVLGLGAMLFAIKIRWDLRKRIWFWVVITFVIGASCSIIPLVAMAAWMDPWCCDVAICICRLHDHRRSCSIRREIFIMKLLRPK